MLAPLHNVSQAWLFLINTHFTWKYFNNIDSTETDAVTHPIFSVGVIKGIESESRMIYGFDCNKELHDFISNMLHAQKD